jgi:hypothetical protein
MNLTTKIHIGFVEKNRAMVTLIIEPIDNTISNIDLLLFTNFTIRQLANIGQKLGPNSINALLWELLNKDNSENIVEIITNLYDNTQLINTTTETKKSFDASLAITDNSINFQLKPNGFGFFFGGVREYALNSIMIFIRFLISKHGADGQYLNKLKSVLSKIAQAHISGQITQFNQVELAKSIIDQA